MDKNPKAQSLKEVAEDWGIDYQTFFIEIELTNIIKKHCEKVLYPLIIFFTFLTFANAEQCGNKNLQEILHKKLSVYNNYLGGEHTTSQEELDDLIEVNLPKALTLFINCLKKNGFDKKKAKIFFDFFLKIQGCASEEIHSYVNKFYINFKQETVDVIQSYPIKDATELTESINFGWDNATYNAATKKSKKKPGSLLELNQKLGIVPEPDIPRKIKKKPERLMKLREILGIGKRYTPLPPSKKAK
ncbi:MAG: hypothetical protein ISR65_02970 [Bacteriovoracaceae bacterium]|nr:hypothetical protein [Bacteriovoracaceae bacterium]